MSADNGIYIGVFGDGEIRVAHAQAVDNCWDENGAEDDVYIGLFFQDAESFEDLESAFSYAHKLEDEIEYTEYGINTLHFQNSFADYDARVNEYTKSYEDDYELEDEFYPEEEEPEEESEEK